VRVRITASKETIGGPGESMTRRAYSAALLKDTSQHSLQEDEIEPSVEFEPHLAEMGDTNES